MAGVSEKRWARLSLCMPHGATGSVIGRDKSVGNHSTRQKASAAGGPATDDINGRLLCGGRADHRNDERACAWTQEGREGKGARNAQKCDTITWAYRMLLANCLYVPPVPRVSVLLSDS